MDAIPPTDGPPGPRGRKPPKARRPKAPQKDGGKRSLNLSLPAEDYERISIHALRAGATMSEIVSRLAREHLREYHLTRTPAREAG